MCKYLLNIALLIFVCHTTSAVPTAPLSKKIAESYISLYAPIAVSEMKRIGIPASIKLAQGLLESDMGRSEMAIQANNHFGIKCGSTWTGDTFYKLDDDQDSLGNIIQSCFRAYTRPEESFIAHSDFLTDPAKISRYGFLFDLSTTDYVGWANGLKFAGYATDPEYPTKLIKIIENYKLYEYDYNVKNMITEREEVIATNAHPKPQTIPNRNVVNAGTNQKYNKQRLNGLQMVYANGGETVNELAKSLRVSIHEIMEYNEDLIFPDMALESKEIVYLEKKHKLYPDKNTNSHKVKSGETLYFISQFYGIRLETLRARNHIPYGAEPIVGTEISLSKTITKADAPRYKYVEKFDQFVDLGDLK
ncbi:MAG: glucosaminidase domain-containing protein [Saprospiraceae bacterium]